MNERMSCERAIDLADEAARGRLGASERARFEAHIEACESCRETYEDARVAVRLFGAGRATTCPPVVVDRILREIHAIGAEEGARPVRLARVAAPRTRALRARPKALWRPAFALAAALVVLWASMEVLQRNDAGKLRAHGPTSFSAGDAERAAAETRQALSIFAQAVERTSLVAGQEVREGLARPVIAGLIETVDRIPSPLHPLPAKAPPARRTRT